MLKINSNQRGFSMIEMMIVVSIIVVISAIALPSYNIWIQNTRIRTAAESIQTGLQKARGEAVSKNARVNFTLNNAANNASWVIGCATVTATCPAIIESAVATEASSSILISTDTGNKIITFTSLGTRDSALVAAEFTRVNIDMSGMSAADSRDLQVRVGTGGGVRMCDPNLPVSDLRAC